MLDINDNDVIIASHRYETNDDANDDDTIDTILLLNSSPPIATSMYVINVSDDSDTILSVEYSIPDTQEDHGTSHIHLIPSILQSSRATDILLLFLL